MDAPRWSRRKVLAAAAAAALGLAALGSWVHFRPPRPVRVMLLVSGDSRQDQGLETLLSDFLETLGGATVVHARAVPSPAELPTLPADLQVLRVQARREGTDLALAWAWTTPARLRTGSPLELAPARPLAPRQALDQWVAGWPIPVRTRVQAALLPASPARFWELLEVLGIRDDATAAASLDGTRRLAEAEPGCAPAWTALGDHLYRSLWVHPEQAGAAFNARTSQAFRRALALVPGYPRAAYLDALFLTDIGDQHRALRMLIEASKFRPGVPDLFSGLAYAGRTAGLLEGARRSLAWRQRLLGGLADPSLWSTETTYLYLGDEADFARELARGRTIRQDASLLFYEGYLALAQGRRDEALAFMRQGGAPGQEPAPFRDLCSAYRDYLEGRREAGLARLKALDEVRGRLRVPDGEWTFKEAEAYALLGDPDRAVDCATRAFVQGFSCDRWYGASPFLGPVRSHPRWPTLARNVRERRVLLERAFPASAFAP